MTLLWLVVVLIAAKTGVELWLNALNRRNVLANAGKAPEVLSGVVDDETYRKSVDYTLAKNSFSRVELVYDAVVLGLVLCSGLLPWAYYGLTGWLGAGLWAQGLVVILVILALSLPGLPLEWWSQFKLEARFGFNRSTLGLWLADKLKGAAVGLVIGYPLLVLLLWFFRVLPNTWWLWGFLALSAVQVLLLLLYPRLILPLFNKLSPMPEGEMRQRLMDLAQRTGFKASTIQVMDGSKRSTHSNAFFTGFGRFRRIVFFDTLLNQLELPELEAVLAHEIGHYRLGHVPKMLVVSALFSFVAFGALGWLTAQPVFFSTFGFSIESGMGPALILFLLVSGLVGFWLTPLMNAWSRRHEYQADAFARKAIGSAAPMVGALRKLHQKNLSNLTPHPCFSAFYYSHPTLVEREAALRQP